MRHLKVMGDLGKIVPMEIHLRNKDSLEAAIRHSDTVYNLLGRDYETRYNRAALPHSQDNSTEYWIRGFRSLTGTLDPAF